MNCYVCQNPCAMQGISGLYLKTKKVFCFLGMPGSGKSTQIKILQENIKNCKTFHVGKFSKSLGLPKKTDGSLISGLDTQFLEYIKEEMTDFTILDGFPRSLEQLDLLKKFAFKNNWEVTFIHVALPKGKEEEISLKRQIQREGDSDLTRIKGKIKRAFECDIQVINALENKIIEIDAMKSVLELLEGISTVSSN